MLKKTIEYTDFDGNVRKEDFYFNLSKAEITEMELSVDGGLSAMIKKVVDAKKTPELVKLFKSLILKSYGVKSEDGRRFIKSEELTKEFTETEAYSILFMELSSDADKAAEFINSIVPTEVVQAAAKKEAKKEIASK